MVAERSQDPPSACASFVELPSHSSVVAETMLSASAGFVPSLMPDVDPSTRQTQTLVGVNVAFYKMMAAGAAALSELMFLKWRHHKRLQEQQRERQQQQQRQEELTSLRIRPDMPSSNDNSA